MKVNAESKLFNTEVRFILIDKIDPGPSKLALRKLAEVNEKISKSKYKNLDEILKRHANDSSPE